MSYDELLELQVFHHFTQCKQMTELLVIYGNTWNYLTLLTYVYKSYKSNIWL